MIVSRAPGWEPPKKQSSTPVPASKRHLESQVQEVPQAPQPQQAEQPASPGTTPDDEATEQDLTPALVSENKEAATASQES